MKQGEHHISILQELQRIYARLVMYVLHSRMDRYQHNALHHAHAEDIKQPLADCVDRIVSHVKFTAKPAHIIVPASIPGTASKLAVPEHSQHVMHHEVNQDNVGDLSRYFRKRSNGAELHPGIKDKLMHSTWDHIYAAIRFANQANRNAANMHINIANSACRELAHYMDKAEYQEFIAIIEQHLAGLLNTSQLAH